MNKDEWKIILEDQIKYDHDYIPSFQTTITILSEILAERDRVWKMYEDSGAQPVVNFTSDRGAINLKQNPLQKQWQELNSTALLYLRDLGLTPAGLRKLQGQLPVEATASLNGNALELIRSKVGTSYKQIKPTTAEELLAKAIREDVNQTKKKDGKKTTTRRKSDG